MDDAIKAVPGEGPLDQDGIADVTLDYLHLGREGSHVGTLDRRIVVVIEVIEDRDVVTVTQERLHKVRTDEPGAAGNEEMHG